MISRFIHYSWEEYEKQWDLNVNEKRFTPFSLGEFVLVDL